MEGAAAFSVLTLLLSLSLSCHSIKKVQANKVEEAKEELAKKKKAAGRCLDAWLLSSGCGASGDTISLTRYPDDGPEEAKMAAVASLSPTSAAAAVNSSVFDDPFADVVASDRDILAQFEPANDADVLF